MLYYNFLIFASNNELELSFNKNLCSIYGRILILMIETGRHKQLKIKERICKSCHLRKIEDEIHFLLECPAYDNIREEFLKKLIDENRSGLLEEIFISIMKSNDCTTIKSLCKYLELAFVKRNEINAAMKDPPRNKTSFSFQVLNRWIWCNSTHSSLFL